MKHLCAVLSSIMLAAVLATPQLSYAGAQQNKMKTCNADADAKGFSGEGKGEQREARKAHGEGPSRSCEEGQASEVGEALEAGEGGEGGEGQAVVGRALLACLDEALAHGSGKGAAGNAREKRSSPRWRRNSAQRTSSAP